MREWIEGQLAAGLPAFSGTVIDGTVAVRQDLLNELLNNWLTDNATSGAAPPVDVNQVKRFVKSAAVRAEPGTVLVDFSIAI